jgi:dTDP-glucose 4,6-dehydratase
VTLPTRRPDLLRARYPAQVATGELEVVAWGADHAIELPSRCWDYVIHGAATTDPATFQADPTGSLRDTLGMAASVADVARASAAKRVVLISSGAVYGDQPPDLPEIPETYQGGYAVAGGASYAEAKRESERAFRHADVALRIARVFSMIGPYQDLGSAFAVPHLIGQADRDGVLTLTTDGSARRSFGYATDLGAILFWLLLGEPRHDVYNVGSRDGMASIADVAATIAEIFGGLEVRRSAEPGSRRDYVPQLDRLYEEYVPTVGLREGLLRTCHSLFARGLIGRRPTVELG